MKKFTYYFELAARLHVFILLNLYGLGKIMGGQFYRKGNLPVDVAQQTLENVDSFDLAWTFMGHSYIYILFIGIAQLIGAWCLLWNRTKLLGIAILIPILVNIIVFDAVFFHTYGALASALIYFLLLMVVLYLNKEQVIRIFKTMTSSINTLRSPFSEKAKAIGIAALIFVATFGLEQLIVNFIGL